MSSIVKTAAGSVVETPYAVRPPARPRHRRRWVLGGAAVVVAALVVIGATRPFGLERLFGRSAADPTFHMVKSETLSITLKEDGELKPVKSEQIKCEVEGQTTIRWIVEESTRVKKDDPLVRLASDAIRDRVKSAEAELTTLRAAVEDAKQALEITTSENDSKINKAEIDLKVAELELERYTKGDYEKAKTANDISLKQTQMEIDKQSEELEKSLPLLEKGFVTATKIKELRDALEKAKMTKRNLDLEREILEAYEKPKKDMQNNAAVEQARDELEREHKRGESRRVQAESKVRSQESLLATKEENYKHLSEQLAKCEILAPADGVVQYGESGGMMRRWGGEPIAAGSKAYEGQTLMTLPDTSQMMVTTRVHEADRHKIREGLTCLVRVPAVPGRTFTGTIKKIAQFADSERGWFNPELKEHAAEIRLDESDAGLSPGDTAHIEVLIEDVPEVLTVPVQCVFARGAKRFVFVQRGVSVETLEVKLGRSSTTMIEVTQGLKAGDKVVMAPDERMLAMLPSLGSAEDEVSKAARAASRPASQPAGREGPPRERQGRAPGTGDQPTQAGGRRIEVSAQAGEGSGEAGEATSQPAQPADATSRPTGPASRPTDGEREPRRTRRSEESPRGGSGG